MQYRYNQYDYKKENPIPVRDFVKKRIENSILFQDLNIEAKKDGKQIIFEDNKFKTVNL